MAVNNSEIEKIYQYYSGDLTDPEKQELLAEINSNDELKEEFEFQKQLFDSFEKSGEEKLRLLLRKNHGPYKLFGKYIQYKGFVLFGLIALIIGAAFLWIPSKESTVSPVADQEEPTTNIVETDHPEPTVAPDEKPVPQPEKVSTNTPDVLPPVFKDTVSFKTKMIPSRIKSIRLSNGGLDCSGYKLEEIENMKVVELSGGTYIVIDDEIYLLEEAGLEPVNDVRVKQQFQFLKKTKKTLSCVLHLFRVHQISGFPVRLDRNNLSGTKILNDTLTISDSTFQDFHLITYEKELYAYIQGEKYLFNPKGQVKKIKKFPFPKSQHFLVKTIYQIDQQRLLEESISQ